MTYVIIILISLVLIIFSAIVNTPRYNLLDPTKVHRFYKKRKMKPCIKRVLFKLFGNTREISVDAPILISGPYQTNTDLLMVYDDNAIFKRIIFQTEYSKERYEEIKKIVNEYRERNGSK